MAGFRNMSRFWLDNLDQHNRCLASFLEYKSKIGIFSDPNLLTASKVLSPIAFWQQYGGAHPELQRVAISSLSCNGSSMDVERLFSIWKQTWNKSTSGTGFDTARKLVAIKFNMTAIQTAKANRGRRTLVHGWMQAHMTGSDVDVN